MQFSLSRTALYICEWWFMANSINLLDIELKKKFHYTLQLTMMTICALNIHMKYQHIGILDIIIFWGYLIQFPG